VALGVVGVLQRYFQAFAIETILLLQLKIELGVRENYIYFCKEAL
jgi:hypothetical protein